MSAMAGKVKIMYTDRRAMPREALSIPVQLQNEGQGQTRDLSAGGMYFTTGCAPSLGETISIAVDLDDPGGALQLTAQAEVLRVDPLDGQAGVAVRWLQSCLRRKHGTTPDSC